MGKSIFKPCSHHKTCKECLIEEYKDIYPNIAQIAVEGANVILSIDIDKRKSTIKIINDAVIINDGATEDYLCNCITDDEKGCRSVELL
ncbi:hypothetical protein [Clostridium botulinum]|uniref:hypothetical protein n=1 Tax=Clostridium botulinum TaxID=1491 RepID=UPI0005F963AC